MSWLVAFLLFLPLAAAQEDGAETLLRTGRYEEAIEQFRQMAEEGPGRGAALDGLARSLSAVGRYDEAEEALVRFLEAAPRNAELWNRLGEIRLLQGKLDGAEEAFELALRHGGSSHLRAQVNLARLERERGELAVAEERFFRLIDAYNARDDLSAEELEAVGDACRALGYTDPQLLKDALRAYDESIAADPSYLEPRVAIGELFLQTYNSTEARESIGDVLEVNPRHPEALLTHARILDFDGSPDAVERTRAVLEVNPHHVEARVFLARLLLELEDYDAALEEVDRALEVNPRSLEGLSILATAHFLEGNDAAFEKTRQRVFELNPHYADFYNLLGDACVRNRLYEEAVEFARRGVKLDPQSWRAWSLLGINLLRIGEIEEGRRHLETAFAGDPYNVWNKNTLDLLDTFSDYELTTSARFVAAIERGESDLLAPLVTGLAEEAYDALAERYRHRPPTPLRLEVYPSHADFSVRTVGLAGLGALGVSFGPVVALDSPSARRVGSFNWGSTLWHELAHTFTLGVTDHKVPRWLTEGLSVVEERRAREGWGDDVQVSFLQAYKDGDLLAIADLNNGFVRPSFPEQIGFSYFQASLVCELIEREHGFDAILAMLHGYRDDKSTEEIFREVLEVDLEEFDEQFDAYLKERFSVPLASLRASEDGDEEKGADERPDGEEGPHRMMPGPMPSRAELESRIAEDPEDFRARMALGFLLFREDELEEAALHLEKARELFPQYAGDDSAYWLLAQIYRQREQSDRAIEILREMTSINETNYEAHMDLARLLEEKGELEEAATVLERALYINPLDRELHVRRSALYEELEDWGGLVRSRRALLALHPVDRAEAHYLLARAHELDGDLRAARRQVLRALEIAPNYEVAQELLLKLHQQAQATSDGGSP